MARRPGTPAGEVGPDPKPCGWSMDLDRQFIGRGSGTVRPYKGSRVQARTDALYEAYEDAAAQAYDYVIAQYKILKCRPPCRKGWDIRWVVDRLVGGLSIRKINIREDTTLPGIERFRASVTVACAFRFDCRERERARINPEPDELKDFVKALHRLVDLLIDSGVLKDP